jgi:alpha-1,6-mannosyltransferase
MCFVIFSMLSWILVFRDPRALIGISNFYPQLREVLFTFQLTLSKHGLNSVPTIIFAITAVIAFVCYVFSLTQQISIKKTIVFSVLFLAITFVSYPILSTDIFSYIFSERVATVHHENIWQVKPDTFPDDQFAVLADWKNTTNIYGGINFLLYYVPSIIGQNNLLLLVILFKLIPTIFGLGIIFILYQLLKLYNLSYPEKLLRLIFWNPLFVLEIFGSAHNDSMMIFFMLLAIYFYKRRYWLLAGTTFALALHIKLIPIVLVLFCIVTLIQQNKFAKAINFLSAFLITNLFVFSFMQVNILNFLNRVAYNGGVYWQSLQTIIQTFYPGKGAFLVICFLLWIFAFSVIHLKKKTDPVYMYIAVLLIYLLFINSAYWNWYILWIFPMLPFMTDKKIFYTILVFTFTSLLAYPLLWVIQRINTPSFVWPIITYISIFGPPIFVYLFSYLQPKRFEHLLKLVKIHNLVAEKPVH